VNDRAAIWLGALAGAVVGGALGYLYLTDRGREMREDVEPALNDLLRELGKAWETAEQARATISEIRQGGSHTGGAGPAGSMHP